MPIKFRCVYCEQLLGIARRKAGSVVKCPNCEGQLIVPAAGDDDVDDQDDATEQAPAPKKMTVPAGKTSRGDDATAGMLFERDNFDELLKPAVEHQPSPKPIPKPVSNKTFDMDPPKPAPVYVDSAFAVPALTTPAPGTPAARSKGITLSPVKLVLLVLTVLFIAAGSFASGIFVGKVLLK